VTPTETPTFSETPSITETFTISPTFSETPTRTFTPSITQTFTSSATPTPLDPLAAYDMGGKDVIAFPVPAKDKVTFLLDSDTGAETLLQVYNFNGDLVSTATFTIQDGRGQTVYWNCFKASPGIYLARIIKLDPMFSKRRIFLKKVAVVR
jgi:hypothetical protein